MLAAAISSISSSSFVATAASRQSRAEARTETTFAADGPAHIDWSCGFWASSGPHELALRIAPSSAARWCLRQFHMRSDMFVVPGQSRNSMNMFVLLAICPDRASLVSPTVPRSRCLRFVIRCFNSAPDRAFKALHLSSSRRGVMLILLQALLLQPLSG